MTRKYSVLADILGRRPRPTALSAVPAVDDVFIRQPDHGPIEYAQVIGVYEEEAQIAQVRLRLFYGFQDNTAELGERTLAADLFGRRFPRMMPAEQTQPEPGTASTA